MLIHVFDFFDTKSRVSLYKDFILCFAKGTRAANKCCIRAFWGADLNDSGVFFETGICKFLSDSLTTGCRSKRAIDVFHTRIFLSDLIRGAIAYILTQDVTQAFYASVEFGLPIKTFSVQAVRQSVDLPP